MHAVILVAASHVVFGCSSVCICVCVVLSPVYGAELLLSFGVEGGELSFSTIADMQCGAPVDGEKMATSPLSLHCPPQKLQAAHLEKSGYRTCVVGRGHLCCQCRILSGVTPGMRSLGEIETSIFIYFFLFYCWCFLLWPSTGHGL